MSEYIQKGYIRIADIIPILDDMRIADILKINKIPQLTLRNFAYLADMRFRFASSKLLRNFAYPPCRYMKLPEKLRRRKK
jgi:hypothetical protein